MANGKTRGAPEPGKPEPDTLIVPVASMNEGAQGAANAAAVVRPSVRAAITIRNYQPLAREAVPLNALVDELSSQCKAVNNGSLGRGEAMLTAQAHTLDAIFNEMLQRAKSAQLLNQFEAFMRAGLKAQSQCRTTWQTLSEMKNPAPATFVRQANIANGPQQVNNGPMREASRAGETRKTPNELSEADNGVLRQDTRASALAGRADPQMATVGEIDGAKDGGG